MKTYNQLEAEHAELFNKFPMFFAFSNEQFNEGMKKLNVTDKADLYSISGGGFIRKTDSKALDELLTRMETEMQTALKDDTFLLSAIKYELGNREYCITYDATETLETLGFSYDDLQIDERLKRIFLQARKEYLNEID